MDHKRGALRWGLPVELPAQSQPALSLVPKDDATGKEFAELRSSVAMIQRSLSGQETGVGQRGRERETATLTHKTRAQLSPCVRASESLQIKVGLGPGGPGARRGGEEIEIL